MLNKIFTIKNTITAAIIIGLIIALIQVDSCRNKDFKKQQSAIDSLTLANQELVKTVNRQGDTIIKQAVIITNDKEGLKDLTLKLFDLQKKDAKQIKEIQALVQIKTKTTITKVEIPYLDTAKMKRFSDSLEKACSEVTAYYRTHSVELTDTTKDSLLSKHVIYENKHFQFDGDILLKKFRINSVNFPDSQRIAFVVTKGGLFRRDINGKVKLFKRKTLEVMVTHTNPYIQVQGMSSVVYKPTVKGRWLERVLLVSAGVALKVFVLK